MYLKPILMPCLFPTGSEGFIRCLRAYDVFQMFQSQLHCFQLSTTLTGIDFKFVSHGRWSEKQNILRQHMHKKEFWILTNKCGNKLEHEKGHGPSWPLSLVFVFKLISTYIGRNPKLFFMHVLKKDVLLL